MKVALLSYGFAEYCIQQANGLARSADVLLLLPQDEASEFRSLVDPDVSLHTFSKPRLSQPVRQLATAARLLRELHRFQPDVIHLQHGHLWFNLLLPLLRSFPLVVTIHDPRHHVGDRVSQKTPQAIMDFGFRRAGRIIVHGETLKSQVSELLGIPARNIHVIPHIAIGTPQDAVQSASERPQILFFGRIWKYKGLEHLIHAQPMISAAIPDAQIIIAGEGEDFEPYRRMMHEPSRFVIHNRFLSVDERDNLFRAATLVVLPYIEATQSGVVPLAYLFAKPVVATNTGALSEAVEHGTTGLLVAPDNPQALANAIVELLSDPARCIAMGAAGRRKLDAECSPTVVAQQALKVYRRVIDEHPRRTRTTRAIPSNADALDEMFV